MRHKRTHKMGILAAVAVGALLPANGAVAQSPASNEVLGGCQLQGTTTITNSANGSYRFVGDGSCIGELNGSPVAGAPLRVTYEGTATVLGGLVPVTGSGKGVATIADSTSGRRYRFPFSAQQAGTVLTATCRGGGNAVAALVPTQPPAPNASTIHLAGVLQTLTPCRS